MTWQDIARGQHGLIRHDQLHRAGLSRHQIASLHRLGHLVSTGRRSLHRVASAPPSRMNRAWLATLATGGTLSHLSAAWLWSLELPARTPAGTGSAMHVTIPPQRRIRPLPGVQLHRRTLPDGHIVHLDGLPVTSRRRTAIDCVAVLPPSAATSALDRWLQVGVLTLDDLTRHLRADPGHHGATALRRLLRQCAAGDAVSERILHRLLRDSSISGWRANARIGPYRVDLAFERARVVVEVDGMAHHIAPDRFQHDRTRQNALVNSGWTVLRFTWADLTTRPGYVLATIRAAIET